MALENQETVRREIERLHLFLEQWLNGTLERSDATFADGVESRLHSDFVNIQPAGIVLRRDALVDQLKSGYGKSPDFQIHIRNVELRPVLDSQAVLLATYEEYQRGARNSARPDNARLSTALFSKAGGSKLTWLHIHETWLPDEAHAAALFDF